MGVCVHYLSNPQRLTDAQIAKMPTGASSDMIKQAPRGSVMLRPLSAAKSTTDLLLCFPFYPTNDGNPIAPGETVWFHKQNASDSAGFWWHRVTAPSQFVEDANYTHLDRQFTSSETNNASGSRLADLARDLRGGIKNDQPVPSSDFPNGAGVAGMFSLPDRDDAYERIVQESITSVTDYTPQAVPPWTPLPNERRIAGKTNAQIVVGGLRSEGVTIAPKAVVDIVAGRENAPPKINARAWQEYDKNTAPSKVFEHNYDKDAGRVAVFEAAPVDALFQIAPTFLHSDGNLTTVSESTDSAAIMKADHTRIVARKSVKLVVQDGTTTKAVVSVEPNGNILITGKSVTIGNDGTDVVSLGISEQEPMVLGNTLVELLQELLTAIKTITVGTGVGPSSTPINFAQFDAIGTKLETMLSTFAKTK